MSVRQDKTGLRTARNGVLLSGDVLMPDAPPAYSDRVRSPRLRRPDSPPQLNWPREILRITIGLCGILLALVMIVCCAGISYVSYKMAGILQDIAKRDFGEATQRFARYTARFNELQQSGHRISPSEPKIISGVTTYLWVVQPHGSDDRIVYRWKHDLNTNTVEPLTNPALLLDIALGYVNVSDAAAYGFYDPNDKLAQALARDDFRNVSPNQLGQRLTATAVPMSPVLPPLVDPKKGRARVGAAPAAAEGDEAAAPANPDAPPAEAKPGDSTDVGNKDPNGGDPPADKHEGDGGESNPEPPDSDAVPVE